MNAEPRSGFWFTNHVLNPVLRPLLRGPLGRRSGRKLAVLRYRGRRTGTDHELVVQYVREGDRVRIVPGDADRKRWWRNMLEPCAVDVWLAGEKRYGTATIIDRQSPGFDDIVDQYRTAFPRYRADPTVMVEINLAPVGTIDTA